MSFRDQLNSYIQQLERRLRLGAMFRGAAILTSVALATTVVLVLITNAFGAVTSRWARSRSSDAAGNAGVSSISARMASVFSKLPTVD